MHCCSDEVAICRVFGATYWPPPSTCPLRLCGLDQAKGARHSTYLAFLRRVGLWASLGPACCRALAEQGEKVAACIGLTAAEGTPSTSVLRGAATTRDLRFCVTCVCVCVPVCTRVCASSLAAFIPGTCVFVWVGGSANCTQTDGSGQQPGRGCPHHHPYQRTCSFEWWWWWRWQ